MKPAALAVGLLLGAACSRKPAPPPGGGVSYAAPGGRFAADLPPGWRVDEAADGDRLAAFFGPPDGPAPYTETIAVSFHPASGRWKSARQFLPAEAAGGLATAAVPVTVAGIASLETTVDRDFPDPHLGLQRTRTRAVLVPAPGGFFALENTRPAGQAPSPAFDDFLASFKPAAAAR